MTARGDGAGRRGGVASARGDDATGQGGHAYAEGDIVKIKGDRVTLYKVDRLLDTGSGTGYRVVEIGGPFKVVLVEDVKERIYTAQEWADYQEEVN